MDGSVSFGNQLVIVALPSQDDYVQQVSSETEPHLTLLYLGENKFDQDELDRVVEYVEHASTMLSPFTLDVESRGELGDDKADVLFFSKGWAKHVVAFREHLLRNDLISSAYNSIDQFPEWLPHLTMGYPDSPAKKDTREHPRFSFVHFDRIAVWTGDSSGPTFKLKIKEYDPELAMSQIERGRSVTDSVLKHYGVKGMKWGVTRDNPSGSSASADARSADAAQNRIDSGGTRSLSNQELQGLITRMNLERQYNMMAVQQQTSIDRGLDTVNRVLKVGKTVEDVRRFSQSPTGKAVKAGIKGAFVAAKMGFAAYTGGVGGAAAAGAGLAVRRMSNHYTNGPR